MEVVQETKETESIVERDDSQLCMEASQTVLLSADDIDKFIEDEDAEIYSYKVTIKEMNNMLQ